MDPDETGSPRSRELPAESECPARPPGLSVCLSVCAWLLQQSPGRAGVGGPNLTEARGRQGGAWRVWGELS